MTSQLHITNGDLLTKRLNSVNLKGEMITWREMLCEGQTLTAVGSESFWKARFEFLNKTYKVSKSRFIEQTLKEYRSLCNHKQQDQIILWFDYDLFCQINMLAVISWLKTYRRHAEISLVSSGNIKEGELPKSLSDLDNKELLSIYSSRKILSQDDIEYADYIWQLYCSNNPIRLENIKDYKNYQFDNLSSAIAAHLKRFPSIRNGLNEVENQVLKVALEQHPDSKKELLSLILKNQSVYGFGDTQYERIITKLKPLFSTVSPVKLSTSGLGIMKGKTSYYSTIQENDEYLGGALKYSFLYNSSTDRILKL
ncbi:DUF1835 domain-containing protein [Sediminicola arcticus]|jgi:hypothetical protein|uniref:DUF1835 domain-containing protein n=1 Tax=Sediminicola arcticus TaxID=1574308 RepID=A0ABV2SU38_9FLAO